MLEIQNFLQSVKMVSGY